MNQLTQQEQLIMNLQHEFQHIQETKEEVYKYDELKKELNELKNDYYLVHNKYTAILTEQNQSNGYQNKKQKIHYINVLKQQINELIEENKRLRG